ncbi:MAG: TetR/AcrR family transcriptional regulator [Pseudomonadota bacterium]
MMDERPLPSNRQIGRTRRAVFDAFRDLVISRRYDDIRVADIIDRANIGRSTFYDHFTGKDDVLLTSLEPLFAVLADAATGHPYQEHLDFVLTHFWEQRAVARIIFGPGLFFKLTRKLSTMIEERLESDPHAAIRAAAKGPEILGLIKAWLAGEITAPADLVAKHITGKTP